MYLLADACRPIADDPGLSDASAMERNEPPEGDQSFLHHGSPRIKMMEHATAIEQQHQQQSNKI